ncbi:hypothetical protein [Phenylobacterium sp.]|uniref:hypothetical protein n=1 Tax=Phenylobacterium sp. TaxID=1871053 RepID=UPI0025F15C1A|nr:hypothetical protein [Phenylobacterium sp.]
MPNEDLEVEGRAFEALHDDLKRQYGPDAWVVVSGGELRGHFTQFRDAAKFVAKNFADRPALLRQVDSAPVHVPYVLMRT